jgi:DNA-binding NtrC family response regulator
VRELRSTLRRALLSGRGRLIAEDTIGEALASTQPHGVLSGGASVDSSRPETSNPPEAASPFAAPVAELLAKASRGEGERIEATLVQQVEQELYRQALLLAGGNQSQAARWLGISRPTLREKQAQFALPQQAGWRDEGAPRSSRRLLIIEDEASFADLLVRVLGEEGYEAEVVDTVEEALPRAERGEVDVLLTDLYLSGSSGLDLVQQLRTASPHLPVILMTGRHDTDVAIEAIKLGAYDYFAKPDALSFEPFEGKWRWVARLADMIEQAFASKKATETVRLPGETSLAERESGDRLLGKSRAMQTVYKEIGRVAASDVTVLIRGETGTGKDLVARAIYQHSSRAGRPFIVINCAAVPETLLESELFGHEAGAFTDAMVRRIGRFEQADGGTLFLDEIGDMSLSTQAKLLRVLQERTFQRLGGKETLTVDVRILAATHRDLEAGIRDGLFRSDLYFRLNEAVIVLPPLRERTADIPELAAYFARRDGAELGWADSRLAEEAIAYLQEQPWPGNIRELRNVIRRALLIGRGYSITQAQIRRALAPACPSNLEGNSIARYISGLLARARRGQLQQVDLLVHEGLERELYGQAFALAGGDQSQVARWLGVSRPTVRDKLIKSGLLRRAEPPPES